MTTQIPPFKVIDPRAKLAEIKSQVQPDQIVLAELHLRGVEEIETGPELDSKTIAADAPLTFHFGLEEPFIEVYRAVQALRLRTAVATSTFAQYSLAIFHPSNPGVIPRLINTQLDNACFGLRYRRLNESGWHNVGTMDHLLDWALTELMEPAPWLFELDNHPFSYLCYDGLVYLANKPA